MEDKFHPSEKPLKDRYLSTFSGKKMHIFDPQPDEICIEDIAHGLSMLCRFSGQTPYFYSVAEHSLLVTRAVIPVDLRLQALLHDATEAYLADIPRPLKHGIPQYRIVEHRLEEVIAFKFGLQFPTSPIVKNIDRLLLQYEVFLFFGEDRYQEDFGEPFKPSPKLWWGPGGLDQRDAEAKFLALFKDLY